MHQGTGAAGQDAGVRLPAHAPGFNHWARSVEATSATVNCTQHGAKGRLNLDVLLPPAPDAVLSKVEGPGMEYWVFGTNYANDPDPERAARSSIETSAWRLDAPEDAGAVWLEATAGTWALSRQ